MHGEIAKLGAEIGPRVRDATEALYASRHSESLNYRVIRDISYGSDPRHRLDIHQPEPGETTLCPVLCFVHGGGFIGGDKHKVGLPYYDNVGQWAAGGGVLGVNITYRFAPEFTYPSGALDVALALDWIDRHVHEFGGDRSRVVIMGHSAGSAHVASCIASTRIRSDFRNIPRGAILSSGVYDPSLGEGDYSIYYGNDSARLHLQSSIPGLCNTDIRLLMTSAEFDPPNIELQTFELVSEMMKAHHKPPEYVLADGHNHYSVMYQFGAEETWFTERVLRFIDSVTSDSM